MISGLLDQTNLSNVLPIKQMFESSHNYVFVHQDIPNSIPFERITASDLTSESEVLDIVIEFLSIELKLNQRNFFTTELNTDNYLLVLPKKFPKQKLELYLISAQNVQILAKENVHDSF